MNIKKDRVDDLVSIIMPAYNCEQFIAASIDSVLNQTYNMWELIIVNDASTDKTAEVLDEYSLRHSNIYVFTMEENSGAAICRNFAINKSKGQYMAFLDSDDIWLPEKLQTQIEFMKSKNISFSCHDYAEINEQHVLMGKIVKSRNELDYWGVLKKCPGNSTVMYDSQNLGIYTIKDFKKRNDYIMWLEVIKDAEVLYGIPKVMTHYRVRRNSISSNKFKLVKYHWIIYRKEEGLNIFKSTYLILYMVLKKMFNL